MILFLSSICLSSKRALGGVGNMNMRYLYNIPDMHAWDFQGWAIQFFGNGQNDVILEFRSVLLDLTNIRGIQEYFTYIIWFEYGHRRGTNFNMLGSPLCNKLIYTRKMSCLNFFLSWPASYKSSIKLWHYFSTFTQNLLGCKVTWYWNFAIYKTL